MKFRVLDNEPLHFYNANGDLMGTISVSGSGDMIIRPESGSNRNIIIGDPETAGDIEVGLSSAAINFKMLGGGTITSNGNTLNIGSEENGDTVNLYNVTYSQSLYITGSTNITGSVYADYFVGSGDGLTRSTNTHTTDFTASQAYRGSYNIVGGNLTCSILSNATTAVDTGAEYDFFQTSSAGNMLFESGSGVTLYVKNNNMNLAGQYSGASLKKVATDTWHLVGDLT